jgi:acetyl-CoA synthetase
MVLTQRRLLTANEEVSYRSLVEGFRWQVPDRFNLGLACADRQDPTASALIVAHRSGAVSRHTFGELDDLSSRLAGGLAAMGIEPGDRVAIIAPQSVEVGVAHVALWKMGAISLPLATLFGPDAISYRLADSGAKAVIVHPDSRTKLKEAAPHLPAIETGPDFEALCSGPGAKPVDTAAEDPAYLIYTSGTTGPPKGALHAHRSLFGHLTGFECYYEFPPRPDDVMWTPADWAWLGGLMDALIPAWYYGIPVLTSTEERFDPVAAFELMADYGVTLAFLPPTALKMMRASGAHRPDLSLRAIFTGGEPLGAEMLDWAEQTLGCHINEGYGQTEANLVVGNCGSVWPVRPGSMGRCLPGHQVEVQDEEGNRLIGEEGEICVRSPDPVMMLGYWNNPGATAEKYRADWLLTGDLGVEDTDGYLWFRSRKDDLITSRGYRIGPGEIEDSLMTHPAVAMCAVVGVPDEIRGHVPAAFVVLRAGVEPSEQLAAELQNHVRNRLAAHETPSLVTFLSELPRTTTGKIMRRALRPS